MYNLHFLAIQDFSAHIEFKLSSSRYSDSVFMNAIFSIAAETAISRSVRRTKIELSYTDVRARNNRRAGEGLYTRYSWMRKRKRILLPWRSAAHPRARSSRSSADSMGRSLDRIGAWTSSINSPRAQLCRIVEDTRIIVTDPGEEGIQLSYARGRGDYPHKFIQDPLNEDDW